MLQQAFRKDKALGLQSELLAARYHCQDGHKRVYVGLHNQNLQAMSISIHVHRENSNYKGEMPVLVAHQQRGCERWCLFTGCCRLHWMVLGTQKAVRPRTPLVQQSCQACRDIPPTSDTSFSLTLLWWEEGGDPRIGALLEVCVCRVRPVKRKKECKWWECQGAGGPLTQAGRKMKKLGSWRRRGEVGLWLRVEWDASRSVATEARRQKKKPSSMARMWQIPSRLEDCMLWFLASQLQQCQAKHQGHSCQNLALGNPESPACVRASSMIVSFSLSVGQK